MKQLITIIFSLAFFSSIHAKTLLIDSGNWFFDKQRTLVLDEFDYIFPLTKKHSEALCFELYDGSIWKVEEMQTETKAFYANQIVEAQHIFKEEWQEGDQLIFHKVFDRNSLLVYNLTRDSLIDVSLSVPPRAKELFIIQIDLANHLLTLSDQSIWYFDHICACKKWKEGEPICVAKDTPWLSSNTHILINLRPRERTNVAESAHRLGVRHVQ